MSVTPENLAQNSVTGSLIALYGCLIVLERPPGEWATTPSGGTIRAGSRLAQDLPAAMRWFQHASANDIQSANVQGDEAYMWGVLVGLAGDDIQKGDKFTAPDGNRYEVRYVHSATSSFETRAEVFSFEP